MTIGAILPEQMLGIFCPNGRTGVQRETHHTHLCLAEVVKSLSSSRGATHTRTIFNELDHSGLQNRKQGWGGQKQQESVNILQRSKSHIIGGIVPLTV